MATETTVRVEPGFAKSGLGADPFVNCVTKKKKEKKKKKGFLMTF